MEHNKAKSSAADDSPNFLLMLNVRKTRLFPLPFFTRSLRLPAGSPQSGALSESCRLSVNFQASQSLLARGYKAGLTIPFIAQLPGGQQAPARSRPGHPPALQAKGSWLLLPQTRAMPPAFPIFTRSLPSCSCLATDKHLIGKGNEQPPSRLGRKAEDSCLTKGCLTHSSFRALPAAIFFTALLESDLITG